jgi:hypothetical protein
MAEQGSCHGLSLFQHPILPGQALRHNPLRRRGCPPAAATASPPCCARREKLDEPGTYTRKSARDALTAVGLRDAVESRARTMSPISSIALSGMSAAQLDLQTSAHNIANLNTSGFRRQEVVQSSVSSGGVATTLDRASQPGHAQETDVVRQLQAKNAFLANLAVFRTSDRMTGSLLDALS